MVDKKEIRCYNKVNYRTEGSDHMQQVISVGNQDFKSIRENNYFYIDKTSFIKEWWENGDSVTLITRPRRFGKTLNMSMVETFFSNTEKEQAKLFEDLEIWRDKRYQQLQGSYPVLFLSFATVKESDYEKTRRKICQLITNLYMKYHFLIEEDFLKDKERDFYESVSVDMDDNAATMALYQLSDYLSRYYGKKVLILLDEYDTPMQEAYVHGYWKELSVFIRSLFNAAFKTNPALERGLLTGITRVSKESIFSDLNNLEVITTTSRKYETSFGFTEEEVKQALYLFDMEDSFDDVKQWYDGFCFGKQRDIYNPWSITKYLDTKELKSYWANTSSNQLIAKLLQQSNSDIKVVMENLLYGKQIEEVLDEEIVFEQLDENENAIWSLLLASGYLKVHGIKENEIYTLSLTNLEVLKMFDKMIQGWFSKPSAKYNDFMKALRMNDINYMNRFMNQMTQSVFSYFDTGGREPEKFYHGFVLGLIADAKGEYTITSNRESGFGRYDVLLEPEDKDQDAYIFEFKVQDTLEENTLQDTVNAALKQIEEKHYDVQLIAKGIKKEKIRHYGFAFCGKKVLIGK